MPVLGFILGLFSAVGYGVNQVFARKAMTGASSSLVANISIMAGIPFFLIANLITGDLFRLGQQSWQSYLFFTLAGVANFALGRTWGLRSVQLMGVTRSNVITGLNFIVTIVLAVVLLGEELKPLVIAGILLSIGGPVLSTIKEYRSQPPAAAPASGGMTDRAALFKGSLFAIGATLFWGLAPVFMKLGLDAGGPPVLGNLVSYVAGALVVSPLLFFRSAERHALFRAPSSALRYALLSSLCSSSAQLLRNLALAYGLVIVVSLTARTVPLWTLLFAFILLRQSESFGRWVLVGNGLLILGSVMVLMA